MYKLVLCWRYLCTRYIAFASIISVTLGVMTMIIVNSVMSGFSSEMQGRIRGIICDVVFESGTLEGMRDPDWHMEQIRRIAGDDIEGMTPICVVPAMLSYQWRGTWVTNQVQVIGIEEKSQSRVSDFAKYLQHPGNRQDMSFDLREDGFDTRDHLADGPTKEREDMRSAGWGNRRRMARELAEQEKMMRSVAPVAPPIGSTVPPPEPFAARQTPSDPFARQPFPEQVKMFDSSKQQNVGVVMGIAMSNYRKANGEEHFRVLPGEDVQLTFPTAGAPPKAVSDKFTIVDFYESKMLEYDSMFIFMPIKELQRQRGMIDPSTGVGYVNAIEIKLHPGADGNAVRDKLKAAFAPGIYRVETWRDKQGALLSAVQMETTILNILLFLIIAVAGFGILAIFYMIVVEKTRDIGILKSLGASGRGVMGIFLTYGLSLGLVGSGVGLILGLLFVHYINPIADGLGWMMGRPLFNPEIYYLYRIPTIVFPETVAWIVAGALGIAMLASVLPALRAARLHPVEALRYE
ncbi:MAG: FtsX-like permease family protein [Planctomycetota bacterium]